MKTSKMIVTLICMAVPIVCLAQFGDNMQAFHVHEDRVKPDKVQAYESIAKELISELTKQGISEPGWLTTNTTDFRYLHLIPISSMADLDKSPFDALNQKIGEAEAEKLWGQFDECYDSHGNYVLLLDKELSYMPAGWDISTPGEDYRRFDFFYVKPENLKASEAIGASIKDLFASKNSQFAYRVYRSGFGAMGPYILVVSSAKSAVDHGRKIEENRALIGKEFLDLYNKLLSYCWKFEQVHGSIRPDLSYGSNSFVNVASQGK